MGQQTVSQYMILIVLVLLVGSLCGIVQAELDQKGTIKTQLFKDSEKLSNNGSSLYSTSDVYKLLSGKKQHLKQVNSALIENNILLDAFELSEKTVSQSALYKSYTSDKRSSIIELNELKSLLTLEISNIQVLYQSKPSNERTRIESDENSQKQMKQQTKDYSSKLNSIDKIGQEQEKKLKEEKEIKIKEEQDKKLIEAKVGKLSESTLLTAKQSERFVNVIMNGIPSSGIKLLFKASRDGFSANLFHSKCDNKGSTIVIVKSTSGAIFGGYSSIPWNTLTAWVSDSSSFLFSLVSAGGVERFTKLTQESAARFPQGYKYTHSKYNHPLYGPTFGGGHDLHIAHNSNENTNSYVNICHTYCDTTMTYSTDTSKTYLAGSYNFQVEDYEVYTL